MHAFMRIRGHARASPGASSRACDPARRPPPALAVFVVLLRDTASSRTIVACSATPSDVPPPPPSPPSPPPRSSPPPPTSTERQAFADAGAVRRRLLAVRRPDLHGRAGDLASRLSGAGPGGLASVGSGLLAPTLQQQARIEEAAAAAAGEGANGEEQKQGQERWRQQQQQQQRSAPPPPLPPSRAWEGAEERAAIERLAAERGDFGLPPGADVAEVEADESARDPRALVDALVLLAGARHHSPLSRRMLLPLLRYAGPRLLLVETKGDDGEVGGAGVAAAADSFPDASGGGALVEAALARPPEPLSSAELVELAHACARIGPAAAPTRRFLAQLLLALRARGFWAPGEDDEGERQVAALTRLSWALPQLAAWADDEEDAAAGSRARAPSPTPDERALWHLLIGRTLADEEGLPWLEREQLRRRREGGEVSGGGGSNNPHPLPEGCVVSEQLAACARLVRRRGVGGTPARELANMLALPVAVAQQLEVASAEEAAVAARSGDDADAATDAPATAFYSAAAEAVRAAALPLAQAAVDALEPSPSEDRLALDVPFEAAALLGALSALGARPRSGWVRAAAAAALDEDFMLPLYELGELADVSRALLAFASRLLEDEEEEEEQQRVNNAAAMSDDAASLSPAERRAWGRALRRAIAAAGAAAAARAAEAGDRHADLAASRMQRAAREAAEALEALGETSGGEGSVR